MRKSFLLLALSLLLTSPALAETNIALDNAQLSVGGEAHVTVTTDRAQIKYDILKDGESYFAGEYGAQPDAYFLPQETGVYTILVTGGNDDRGAEDVSQVTLTVAEPLGVSVQSITTQCVMGQLLSFTAAASGGTGHYTYGWSVYVDGARIYYEETKDGAFSYAPDRAGEMYVLCAVTDTLNEKAQDAGARVTVQESAPSLAGTLSAAAPQGGAITAKVNACGVWTAKTDADYVKIMPESGLPGDTITFLFDENTAKARTATILLSSDGVIARIPVTQTSTSAAEEETSMFALVTDYIRAEGRESLSWVGAAGEKAFLVDASGEFTANTPDDFLSVRTDGRYVYVTAEENTSSATRTGTVTLLCGQATATLYCLQAPAATGAKILSVQMDEPTGVLYETEIHATVTTDLSADTLSLYGGARTLSWSECEIQDNARVWDVTFPLTKNGDMLFSADGISGRGDGYAFSVSAQEEAANFASAEADAQVSAGTAVISFRVTGGTQSVDLLDENGEVMRTVAAQAASIDHYIDAENEARYADWTIVTADSALPAALAIGQKTIPVEAEYKTLDTAFEIFDQCDGTWEAKKYRTSTLEHSGCAIFALSHALHYLGITGENTEPEQLAKTYAFCLVDGGTLNSTLIGNAAKAFGFTTRYALLENLADVKARFENGAVFTFSVVSGHIAMAAGISEDGTMIRIIDSAMSATFTRIKNEQLYIYNEGTMAFEPITALSQIEGAKYYIVTASYGGGSYYLPASYVIKRGVRLIQPSVK